MQSLRPRDRSRQRAETFGQQVQALAHHRHSLPLHGARSERDGAEGHRHSRRRRNAERQRPCQRPHQKHPAAARQDRFSETDRSRHPPRRHGPRRHRRAGDLALSRSFRLRGAAGSGARQLPHGQRPHRRDGRETPRPADGHGHRAAAGSRHGRRRAEPHRQGARLPRRRTLHQCQGRRSHPRRAGKILRPRRGARRDDLPASVRHQPRRAHGGSLFPEHRSDIRWIPRCASGTWFSTAISNAFPN